MTDFLEHHTGSPICVVAFASSGANRNGVPVFEWKRTLDQLGVSYILLRDSEDRWYQDGVKGIGGPRAVAEDIRNMTRKYSRKIALGLSSGAYAALNFGQRAFLSEIIAISPVTMMGPSAETAFFPQWSHRVALPFDRKDLAVDLTALYRCAPIYDVKAFVTDGDGAELDARMCELIGITPTLIPGQTHAGLARHMLDIGLVQKLIMGEA